MGHPSDWDIEEFGRQFSATVAAFDRPRTEESCDRLIEHLRAAGKPYDPQAAAEILRQLRSKRYFDLLQRVADTLQQTGVLTPTIRHEYAQALLDQGGLSAALPFIDGILKESVNQADKTYERSEGEGLLGRAYKQIYVDIDNPVSPEARDALNQAIHLYQSVYRSDPSEHTWHGINAVALLQRAAIDQVEVRGVRDANWRSVALAQEILGMMRMKWDNGSATLWDSGTGMEAAIALGLADEARTWLNRYVREPQTDAFELASTLRQLEEVWRLDVDNEPGSSLLPVLRGELLRREGGSLVVTPDQLKPGKLHSMGAENLEKILGKVRYVSYRFMLRAIERARAVARIEHQPDQGFGSGFVVPGNVLHGDLGSELLLVTNSHVVSESTAVQGALRPDEAIVTFQLSDKGEHNVEEYPVAELVWSSPPWELDVTVLRLTDPPSGLVPFPVAPRLPLADGEQRVYVIGHPKGGSLSFSIQDNVLLDYEIPRLHYRAPTEGGSSGSPVFNSQWKLIGLHHAGAKEMRKLNNKAGTYAANEGLWIQSIIQEMEQDPQKIGA